MEQKAKLTFLGTGTSSGIPMIACDCAVCHSADPRDKRLRASVLVEYGGLTILVDAGPDFRTQMLLHDVHHLDAILLTHNHKDHTGGLDDIRAFNLAEAHPVNIFCEPYVETTLRREYGYAFAEEKYPGAPEWRLNFNLFFSKCVMSILEVILVIEPFIHASFLSTSIIITW